LTSAVAQVVFCTEGVVPGLRGKYIRVASHLTSCTPDLATEATERQKRMSAALAKIKAEDAADEQARAAAQQEDGRRRIKEVLQQMSRALNGRGSSKEHDRPHGPDPDRPRGSGDQPNKPDPKDDGPTMKGGGNKPN
jgi:hypothetical protein